MATEAYRRFFESFFGQTPDAAREGPDVGALLSLQGEERVHAEQLLLDRLGTSDSRPAIGLGALGTTRAAPRLRALLGASRPLAREIAGGFLTNVAAASWRIEKNPEAVAALVDVLSSSPLATAPGGRGPGARRHSDARVHRGALARARARQHAPARHGGRGARAHARARRGFGRAASRRRVGQPGQGSGRAARGGERAARALEGARAPA